MTTRSRDAQWYKTAIISFLAALVLVIAAGAVVWYVAGQRIQLEAADSEGARPAFVYQAVSTSIPQRSVQTAGHVVSGSAPGLYGGSGVNSCDIGLMKDFLARHPVQATAWAQALMISVTDIPALLASLTPLTLRTDTAVTNHGFDNGVATPFQSVLQSGTAVLVDALGLPRVRCRCGNPLQGPAPQVGARYEGERWNGFDSESVMVVSPATRPIHDFVVVKDNNKVVSRPLATEGQADEAVSLSQQSSVLGGPIGSTGSGSNSGPNAESTDPAAPPIGGVPSTPTTVVSTPEPSSDPSAPDPSGTVGIPGATVSGTPLATLEPTAAPTESSGPQPPSAAPVGPGIPATGVSGAGGTPANPAPVNPAPMNPAPADVGSNNSGGGGSGGGGSDGGGSGGGGSDGGGSGGGGSGGGGSDSGGSGGGSGGGGSGGDSSDGGGSGG